MGRERRMVSYWWYALYSPYTGFEYIRLGLFFIFFAAVIGIFASEMFGGSIRTFGISIGIISTTIALSAWWEYRRRNRA